MASEKIDQLTDELKLKILQAVAEYVNAITQAYIEEALGDLVGGKMDLEGLKGEIRRLESRIAG